MIHRAVGTSLNTTPVVNCFQISTLVDDSQGMWPRNIGAHVVNCFQISTLVDDSQALLPLYVRFTCCELLSDFYFSR